MSLERQCFSMPAMTTEGSQQITPRARRAINDLVDNLVKVRSGQEVLILAHTDGLHGSDNLVDETAIAWIQSAILERGATPSVL